MARAVEVFDDLCYYDNDATALFWEGDLKVDGDLWLDDDKYTGKEAQVAEITTFVIAGDLEVGGTVINDEGDYGINLIVLGNVKARNAVFGGCNVYVAGDMSLSGYAVAFYNHGSSHVEGTLAARAVINHDNYFGADYPEGMQVLRWGGAGEESLEDYCLKSFVDDGYPLIGDIRRAVLDGKPFLDEKKPKTQNAAIARALAALAKGKATKKISLEGHKGAFPTDLLKLDSLEVLDIRGMKSPLPAQVGEMPRLKELVVGCYMSEEIAATIGGFSKLEKLTFRGPNEWFGAGELEKLGPLFCRDLQSLRQLTIPKVRADMLERLPRLETLLLKDAGGGSTDIAVGHPGVTRLVIEVSRGELENLNAFPALEEFEISGWRPGIPPEPLDLPRLEKVSMRFRSYEPEAGPMLQAVLKLPALSELEVAEAELRADDFKGLEKCQKLSSLKLEKATAKALGKGVVDRIKKLTGLEKLELIGVASADKVQEELSKALPGCKVSVSA